MLDNTTECHYCDLSKLFFTPVIWSSLTKKCVPKNMTMCHQYLPMIAMVQFSSLRNRVSFHDQYHLKRDTFRGVSPWSVEIIFHFERFVLQLRRTSSSFQPASRLQLSQRLQSWYYIKKWGWFLVTCWLQSGIVGYHILVCRSPSSFLLLPRRKPC